MKMMDEDQQDISEKNAIQICIELIEKHPGYTTLDSLVVHIKKEPDQAKAAAIAFMIIQQFMHLIETAHPNGEVDDGEFESAFKKFDAMLLLLEEGRAFEGSENIILD